MTTETYRNGCWDRADYAAEITQQDGWHTSPSGKTRAPNLVQTPHRMAKDCQYTHDKLVGSKDPGCNGCPRKAN